MIAFKKMWDDVNLILSNSEIKDFQIVEKFNSGFVVKDDKDTHFVTKEDFVDFWCNMLCFNKVDKVYITKEGKLKLKYVYEIIKKLPYIKEECEGTLNLIE